MNKGLIRGGLKRDQLTEIKIIPWRDGDNYNDHAKTDKQTKILDLEFCLNHTQR